MSEPESVTERELAEFLAGELSSDKPRSVGEALAAADEPQTPPEPPEPPAPDEPPIVVRDEPGQAEPETSAEQSPIEGEEPPSGEEEEQGEEEPADEHVAWAVKKYGEDSAAWAKAAHQQEQHISRLAQQRQEAQQLAAQWYEYAQSVEAQAQASSAQMPMSSQEEAWVEQAMANPLEYARAAAFNGNVALYQGVINRIAEENPGLAANIGAQVQMDLQQAAAAQQQNGQPPPLQDVLGYTFQRLGMDLNEVGPAMSEKIGDLGEHHPYVQAILYGDQSQRELAVQAVHDLVRATSTTRRVVRNQEREDAIKREGELRREAAGVVTGAPHTPPPPAQSPFMQAMEDEWKARGQWAEE